MGYIGNITNSQVGKFLWFSLQLLLPCIVKWMMIDDGWLSRPPSAKIKKLRKDRTTGDFRPPTGKPV